MQRGSAHLRGSRGCEKAHREAGDTPQCVEHGGVGKEWDRSRPGPTITTTPADDPDAERMDRGESARVGFVLARVVVLPVAAAWLIQTCEVGWASSAATEATEAIEATEATKHEHEDSWTT